MGEKDGIDFEIKILFALSRRFIDQLADGKYGLNTRESNHTKRLKALEEKVKAIAVKKELLDTQVGHLEDEKKLSQKRLIAEKMKSLTSEELEAFKDSYENLMLTATTGEGSRFRENGWDDSHVQFMFELFLAKKLEKLVEISAIEENFSEKEKVLQESRGSVYQLYDMGIKALRGMRSLKTDFTDPSLMLTFAEERLIGEKGPMA